MNIEWTAFIGMHTYCNRNFWQLYYRSGTKGKKRKNPDREIKWSLAHVTQSSRKMTCIAIKLPLRITIFEQMLSDN